MSDIFSSVFGAAGIDTIQIGSKKIAVAAPKTKDSIVGYGDTIKVGDVFYYTLKDNGKTYTEGPYRLDAVSDNDADPWFRFVEPDGGKPVANYVGSGWKRTFKLADKETTDKLNAALQWWGLHVRLYVTFNNLETPARPTLIPACWIAWVGDLQKAFREYDGPFGNLKKKNIVKWVKTGMFKDFTMKSKVAIPKNFPVEI